MADSKESFSLEVEIVVGARIEDAWSCLMDPKKSAEFFWGISFESDLKTGSPITWSGVWEGKPFVDRGRILAIEKPRLFRYRYHSAFSGRPDAEENYQTITYAFDPAAGGVRVRISQSNIPSREAKEHSEANWRAMLKSIKDKLEA